ncbi:hypothetical protein [Burkholderia pseudomallei]|uniref:hypothetical protein n=1 Tax=Burkholderia pseudomallei TaxID=28450 RepID=UPI000F2687E5|nr:hypothetical protein [Burkholderia pseudomallei]CAJ3096147.1 Uncharacterised protein [Burkholderia pseudomallei]CAJ6163610.1 Uncharacterised protein [Burkholderia pseudomallei]VCE84770.1 Uncharacterised protein [Burkholderia pseudomallei]VCF05223.1 Uncharacterised protein [Burkholderia pseudomallei]VCF34878.1 Uncharacterised protein [Burkholderia pseudomallei]
MLCAVDGLRACRTDRRLGHVLRYRPLGAANVGPRLVLDTLANFARRAITIDLVLRGVALFLRLVFEARRLARRRA